MELIFDNRSTLRRPAAVPAVADYDPHKATGTWWENFPVRVEELADGGCRIACSHPVEPGAHIRLVVAPDGDPTPRDEDESAPPLTQASVEGEIVWVRGPVVPPFGRYRAGIVFRPALQHGLDGLREAAGQAAR